MVSEAAEQETPSWGFEETDEVGPRRSVVRSLGGGHRFEVVAPRLPGRLDWLASATAPFFAPIAAVIALNPPLGERCERASAAGG
jgi:hypothetical protein